MRNVKQNGDDDERPGGRSGNILLHSAANFRHEGRASRVVNRYARGRGGTLRPSLNIGFDGLIPFDTLPVARHVRPRLDKHEPEHAILGHKQFLTFSKSGAARGY